MCHLRVELDTLSLKTLPSYMFCTPLKKMFYDQLFMLEPVPSVVSYSIFVRIHYIKVACRSIESVNFQYL